jgi:MFS transporter, putative metabolite:H+ symporter
MVLFNFVVFLCRYGYVPEQFPTLYRSRCFGITGTFGKLGGLASPILFGYMFGKPEEFPRILVHLIISGLFLVGLMAALTIRRK